MRDLGPVSRACASELRELARQRGIVVWLDREAVYSDLARRLSEQSLAGEYDVPVLGFGGSYLDMLFRLEGMADGVGMVPLVVHVPGLTEEDLRATPLLELYKAGQRHRRALPTLVREAAHGIARAEDIEQFVSRGDLTLAAADEWLSSYRTGDQAVGPDLSALDACALFEAMRPGGSLASKAGDPLVSAAVWRRAGQLLGVTDEWRTARETEIAAEGLSANDTASLLSNELAAWSMCVEFVDDLRRPPKDEWLMPLTKLAKPFRQASRDLAVYLRERHGDYYVGRADELQGRLEREEKEATAADLGRIDTFRFEDQKVLSAGLDALRSARFQEALDWAIQRTDGRSFWTQRDRSRRLAWQLVELSAQLGLAIERSGDLLEKCQTTADAALQYAEGGHDVDRHHRLLEQAWQQAPLLDLDEFASVRQCIEGMRKRYRQWADRQTAAFNQLCQKHGYLPSSDYQQRRLFDDVVQPLTGQDGVTAYFLVDALRYEMGAQLAEAIGSAASGDVIVKPRLAELPTVTEVGMNILAPVSSDGKLRPDICDKAILGFRAGEVRVSTPDARRKAMHQRVGGDTCPGFTLEEVVSRDVASLRKSIARSRLVVVHSIGIDKAGESGFGLGEFERELQNIRAAWNRLYEAGVKRFVITADHGFLLHDSVTRNPRRHGNKTTPKRRHVVSELEVSHDGEVRVSSTELGYEGTKVCFIFPEDAAPFDTGEKAKDFVHGGNSLQERVIPVVTIQHRYQAGSEVARYRFDAERKPPVAHMHCVRARLVQEGQTSLAYGGRKTVEVTLYCEGSAGAQLKIVDVRDAEHRANTIAAPVEGWFEVFFRVTSDRAERVRVTMVHATGGSTVDPYQFAERFDAEVRLGSMPAPEPVAIAEAAGDLAWLNDLPEGGVRNVFKHLANHGSINETEATAMLGGPRKFRSFSRRLDTYVAVAPFRVRVEVASGVKCYVRGEG